MKDSELVTFVKRRRSVIFTFYCEIYIYRRIDVM